ncbi:hypothetical protein [Cryptosporangium sp. NPDC051539]|uniref:hypothetical protein n=1 Tax=Cryptosporangium sp. NPDC051539 TaxID=3363962 RepID=UPI00379A8731
MPECCPVCLREIEPADVCGGCGWVLRSGVRLGGLTDAAREAFAAKLGAAQHAIDARAAVRVLDSLGADEPGLADRMRRVMRGSGAPVAGGGARPRAEDLGGMLAPHLARLVAGEIDRLAVVEIGAEAVTLHRVRVDRIGTPVSDPAVAWAWTALVPALPSDRELRLLRLAGGIGDGDGAAPTGAELTAGRLPAELTERSLSGALVLVRRVASWPVLDALVDALAERLGTPAAVTVAGALDDALRRAPLRHDYALAIASLDPSTGRVAVVPKVLFGRGTSVVPGREPIEDVPVARIGADDEVTLAVVACPEGRPEDWYPVQAAVVALPGDGVTVQIALEGPGKVRFLAPVGVRDVPLEWNSLLGRVQDAEVHQPVDCVFAVELGGAPAEVQARLDLIENTLALLAAEHPQPLALRVAVIGYDDHVLDGGRRVPPVVHPAGLEPIAAARTRVRTLRPAERGHPLVAPVEDAIAELPALDWRTGIPHVLAVLGSRPPHPPEGDGRSPRCPRQFNWETTMDGLVRMQSLRRVAVRFRPEIEPVTFERNAPGRAQKAWHGLGADGVLDGEVTSAWDLAQLTGLEPRPRLRSGVPLPGLVLGGAA